MFCGQKRLSDQEIQIGCPSGTYILFDKILYGGMSTHFQRQDYCREEQIWKHETQIDTANCTEQIDRDYVDK